MTDPGDAPSRLARRLGVGDAVTIGLGSMIGAGVFAAVGPAARAGGSGLMLGLAIAGLVAYCNATSSAELAAVYPSSGGTYVYGRERLGRFWGVTSPGGASSSAKPRAAPPWPDGRRLRQRFVAATDRGDDCRRALRCQLRRGPQDRRAVRHRSR